ncbi:Rhamnogalacturonate lyase A [Diplonema papillatum]|nr:Rhamnogalacturonate lyase A [Diplonema papillatum]
MTISMRWALLASAAACVGGFSLNTTDDMYTIDTGADLVFTVRRTEPPGLTSTSIGGIESLLYKGVEYTEEGQRDSHIGSGFDWLYEGDTTVTVDAVLIDDSIIKVTVETPYLIHYYIVKKGVSPARIYMGTYWSKQPNTEEQIRFLFRLDPNKVPDSYPEGDVRNNTGAIESKDIFGTENGETRSKHHTNQRVVDWQSMGVTGDNVGMYIVRGNHEMSSGGPFYRCIRVQTKVESQELTYMLNYRQAQTEPYRKGTLAVYTFVVTDGGEPDAAIDYGFYGSLNLTGYVPPSGRGEVACSGVEATAGVRHIAGFSNDNGQYWAIMDAATGAFRAPGILPGVYTMTIFKNELEVHVQEDVAVAAGQVTELPAFSVLAGDPSGEATIFRIGDWDGSPEELRNGEKITRMHPSDVRMDPWVASPFVVGNTSASEFPGVLFKAVNNDYQIHFKMTDDQKLVVRSARVGITVSHNGARPLLGVNGWTSKVPSSPPKLPTRTLTTGTYRGNNKMFTYEIPTTAWTADEYQVLTVTVASGSGGSEYLSPAMAIDCVDLLEAGWSSPAPATMVPTQAPATQAPATRAPATRAPATTSPGTPAPETTSPSTSAPATLAPPTATSAPSSSAASTAFSTVLAAATTAALVVLTVL